jgi:hypothetical protein
MRITRPVRIIKINPAMPKSNSFFETILKSSEFVFSIKNPFEFSDRCPIIPQIRRFAPLNRAG